MGFAKKPCHPTETIGCDNEIDPKIHCKPNNTIIEFRPNRAYVGEFGFDWLRVNDISGVAAPYVSRHQVANEPPYRDCILGSHASGLIAPHGATTEQVYNDLKAIYMDNLPVNREKGYKDDYNGGRYFIPFLNLFSKDVSKKLSDGYKAINGEDIPFEPTYYATLRMMANVRGEKPEKVTIEFENEFFDIVYDFNKAANPRGANDRTHKIDDTTKQEVDNGQITVKSHYVVNDGVWFNPDNPDGKNKEGMDDITLICLKEFADKKYIEVFAHYSKGKDKKKLAGKLCILPNDDAHRKVLPIVLVRVRTNVEGTVTDEKIGTFGYNEIKSLYYGLYQALIFPSITSKKTKVIRQTIVTAKGKNIIVPKIIKKNIILDLSNDKNFWGTRTNATGVVTDHNGKFIDSATNYLIDDLTDYTIIPLDNQATHAYLKSVFDLQTSNLFSTYFPAFSFGMESYFYGGNSGMGIIQAFGIKNLILTELRSPSRRESINPYTCAHEAFHGLGLEHTHPEGPLLSANKLFVYHPGTHAQGTPIENERSTDNVMSYKNPPATETNIRSSWIWQWEIMQQYV